MSCTRELSITITETPEEITDMPFNNAVYESGRDKIFTVRGGYVFKCNASTGAIEASSRYACPDFDDAYICYEPNDDKLYVTLWFNNANQNGGNNWKTKYLFSLNPDTLSVIDTILFDITFFNSPLFEAGPRQIVAVAGFIFGIFHRDNTTSSYAYRYSPGGAVFIKDNISTAGWARSDVKFVPNSLTSAGVMDTLWFAIDHRAIPYDTTLNVSANSVDFGAGIVPRGLAYAANNMYAVVADAAGKLPQHILSKKADNTGAVTTIDSTRTNALPFNIRYWSVSDRIYVPTWPDNAVIILNPNTNSIDDIKEGFDSPFDIVATASKVFAVQHGLVGLKEIV